ncbi:MAG: carboxypeptidase regulatory-like domain-containing protein [Prevotella sp.]|nr:carboxypeptidase regulatory-like domain-containing protein [Prevotella sp.]
MKQQDIDKKIGMPDVDKEWVRFEREVIGTNSKSRFRHAATWTIGIGIAATILLLFVLNTDMEKDIEMPLKVQQVALPRHQDDLPTNNNDNNVMRLAGTGADTLAHSKSVFDLDDEQLQDRIAQLVIVPTSADLGPGSIMRLGSDSHSIADASLLGLIGGTGDSFPIHFVSKKERRSLPYLWERDTVLLVVNGKVDADFMQYISEMPYWSMASVYDYFFKKNQLFIKQSLHTEDLQSALCDSSVLTGRDIRLVVNYQTKPFTPVNQLHTNEIMLRRQAYLKNKYLAGFKQNSNQEYYSPDIYNSPIKERIFGLTAAKCHSGYAGRNEYFGSIGSDKNGTYVPLIRDVVLTTHDDSWYENGEIWILKDDTHFNQVVDDIRQAATSAESSIIKGDSIVTLAFIYGGKVAEGQPNDLTGRYMQKRLYEKAKVNTFKFNPDVDAPSYWWAEVYYSTTSITSQRQLWMHLHSVDKLYTADCPEIIANSRKIEGIVLNEKDEPLTGAIVCVGYTPTPETGLVRTDSTGYFELCLPYPNASIQVSHIGYETVRLSHPADTTLTIRMRNATKLREVKVLPKKKMEQYQRIE